jgi:glycerol kinase
VFSDSGLLTTIAWKIGDEITYALEGSVFTAGAAIQWLRDEIGIIEKSKDSELMAVKVSDTHGVFLVPAFSGLGAPHWNPYARGIITGLTRSANKYHIVRAALESIAYQSNDLLAAMKKDTGLQIESLRADGGASENDFLMQFQADILGIPVQRPVYTEATALGVAYLAGLAVGFWNHTDEIAESRNPDRTFEPAIDNEKRNELIAGWNDAVKAALL